MQLTDFFSLANTIILVIVGIFGWFIKDKLSVIDHNAMDIKHQLELGSQKMDDYNRRLSRLEGIIDIFLSDKYGSERKE